MGTNVGSGFLTVLLGGLLQGTVLTPMAYLKRWQWENIWLLYATYAYLLLPWVFALTTVPHLVSAFEATPSGVVQRTAIFGFLWGLAVVLFGVGIDLLGLGLGFAIILGLGTSIGSLVPLIGQHREQLWKPAGIGTLAGVFLLTIAVAFFSVAGKHRDRVLNARLEDKALSQVTNSKARFITGLIVCILCGVLNPLYNIAFAYGAEIQKHAIAFGAKPSSAGNGVWLLVANAGFFPSLFYTFYLLHKNRTWAVFRRGTPRYWLLTPTMGLMWISGTVLYGIGANLMGSLGPVIGWPALMSTMVLTANFWGLVTGEWKGVGGKAARLQMIGLTVLVFAMFMLGWSSKV